MGQHTRQQHFHSTQHAAAEHAAAADAQEVQMGEVSGVWTEVYIERRVAAAADLGF
jgi:hypothetical protein